MTDKQMPLWDDPEVVLTWNSLNEIEQLNLNLCIAHEGGMIPAPYDVTKEAIRTLKEKGLIRDSLLAKGYVEITELGNKLADDYYKHLTQTGQMWTCSR